MAQDMKSLFAAFGSGPFAWPKTGAMVPDMANWVRIQQDMATAAMEFGQRMATMAKTDLALGGDVLRRLMMAKTPEELAAWQSDMLALVSSKYFEQWIKLGEQVQQTFAKAATPAQELELVDASEGKDKGPPKPKLVA